MIEWTDPNSKPLLNGALRSEIESENHRQLMKWGVQTHTPAEWLLILAEEFGELSKEVCDTNWNLTISPNLREEAIQVATLALKIAEMGQ
jgi:hypothetical protein